MADLRKTAKSRGMGGFIQVTALMEQFPDLESFFSIVTSVKTPPPGVENASLILVLDETPLDSCNEIALNQTNTNRVVKFLEREYGDADDQRLIDCAIHFRIKKYVGYQAAGLSQFGIEISMIEGPEGSETRPMTFEAPRPPEPTIVSEDKPDPRKIRRAEIQKRLAMKATTADKTAMEEISPVSTFKEAVQPIPIGRSAARKKSR